MFADLPAELLQQIIERHLAGDSRSLKSCSLVCWQWRHITLPVLMSKVAMTSGGQLTADDLHDAIPFLSQYLRHLIVSAPFHLLRGDEDANEANGHGLLYAILAVAPQFTHLSRISLTGDAMFKLLSSTQADLSNICHFTVYRPDRTLPIKTITAFTHLRVLHLIGISLDLSEAAIEWSRNPCETNASVPVLEELALQLSPKMFDIFVQWACRTKMLDFSQLKTIKLSTADGEAETDCQLAPLVGTNVQTLEFDFYRKSIQF